MNSNEIKIEIQHLTTAYGSYVVMRDINARIQRGSIFLIMGESGAGKSTLLRNMIGLQQPASGDVLYDGRSFWGLDEESRRVELRRFGVLFQSGALWSSMTLAENVGLPLAEYTDWPAADRQEVARLKLALVGLGASKIIIGPRFPAGCANAPAWHGPWRWIRKSFFSTNRRPGLTRFYRGTSTN